MDTGVGTRWIQGRAVGGKRRGAEHLEKILRKSLRDAGEFDLIGNRSEAWCLAERFIEIKKGYMKIQDNQSYRLTVKDSKSKIAAALCHLSQPGYPGEALIKGGFGQEAFGLFCAKIALKVAKEKLAEAAAEIAEILADDSLSADDKKAMIQDVEIGRDAQGLALLFEQISACNASAARQAMQQKITIQVTDSEGKPIGKEMILETWWGGSTVTPSVNLNSLPTW